MDNKHIHGDRHINQLKWVNSHTLKSLHGSEAHPTRVSPDATELHSNPGISACEREASPPFRVHPPTTVGNLLHCRVSACGPKAPSHQAAPSLTSRSAAVASQVCRLTKAP